MEFFDKLGHYSRIGGLEVARRDDDERMQELKRKVGSGKGLRYQCSDDQCEGDQGEISAAGRRYDPGCNVGSGCRAGGAPRSQTVVGVLG